MPRMPSVYNPAIWVSMQKRTIANTCQRLTDSKEIIRKSHYRLTLFICFGNYPFFLFFNNGNSKATDPKPLIPEMIKAQCSVPVISAVQPATTGEMVRPMPR